MKIVNLKIIENRSNLKKKTEGIIYIMRFNVIRQRQDTEGELPRVYCL